MADKRDKGDGCREMFFQRLTIVNSVALLVIAGLLIGAAVAKRDALESRLQAWLSHDLYSSRVVERLTSFMGGAKYEPLPRFDLGLDSSDLRQVEVHARNLVRDGGILTKDARRWHTGKFGADGKSYRTKLRIRGDKSFHWEHKKKSWRVKFADGNYFRGYRELNLLIPQDKVYEVEKVVYDQARRMGLLVPDAGFAHVRMNQVDMGLYFWFEQPGKEMLEKLRYPEGEIFSEDDVWLDNRQGTFAVTDPWLMRPSAYEGAVHKGSAAGGHIQQRWNRLLYLARDGDDERFASELPQLVDLEKFARWNALLTLFGSYHGQGVINVRWYYDTTVGLFEPMPYDVLLTPLHSGAGPAEERNLDHQLTRYNPMVRRILSLPDVRQRRNAVLLQLIHKEGDRLLDAMAETYERIRPYIPRGVGAAVLGDSDAEHEGRLQQLRSNMAVLERWLSVARVFGEAKLAVEHTPALEVTLWPEGESTLQLRRLRIIPQSAFPEGFRLEDMTLVDPQGTRQVLTPSSIQQSAGELIIELGDAHVASGKDDRLASVPAPWTLYMQFAGLNASALAGDAYPAQLDARFHNALTGERLPDHLVRMAAVEIPAPFQDPDMPVAELAAQTGLPFRAAGDQLILEPGNYTVRGEVIIPAGFGLTLGAGTRLRMAPSASIVSYRSLTVAGTRDHPVVVEPLRAGEPWGVLAVLNTDGVSRISHLRLQGGSERWINGAFLSGQLSFYHADVEMDHSVIGGAHADDGLNIKHACFAIRDSVIARNASDGFDGDWVTGYVLRSLFRDNGGDGVDFSGSNVMVDDSQLTGMGDKAVSAGENSRVYLVNAVMADSEIGVAAKDLSQVQIFGGTVAANQTGFALYQKKPVFGPGAAELYGTAITGNVQDFTVQARSRIALTGVHLDRPPSEEGVYVADAAVGELAVSRVPWQREAQQRFLWLVARQYGPVSGKLQTAASSNPP